MDILGTPGKIQRNQEQMALDAQRREMAERQASDAAWKASGGKLGEYYRLMSGYSPEYAAKYQEYLENNK